MIALVKKTKTAGVFITVSALALLIAGCDKEKAPAAAPEQVTATETVDLAQPAQQTPDLFEQPLQPNPLALSNDDVVVTVDGKNITHGEIMKGVQMNMMQMSRRVPPQQLQQMAGQMYKNVTDTLIANILLTKAAETSSLTVNDEELTKEITTIEANAPEGSSLTNALAENNIDFNEWKNDLRKQMLIRKLVEEKTANITNASLAEVTKFYEENVDSFKIPESVTASHILLAFTPEDTDATKAQKKQEIEKIRADILAGGDFAAIAAEKSDCPSKTRGGNLGTFSKGQMVPEFENVAFTQEVGTVSGVVETQFGYHLIKVTDHQQAGIRSLSEVKDQLQEYLAGKAKQDALLVYIEELKSNANVVMHTPDLDAASK
ncbi:MAG: peptidylprolyl isomerase [Kiritimatiellales bacterium]|nr:peptidylprolyl isomerase [Kiritimatiellales bacterium]